MSNKKIGVLTSGGDCGGLNAAIRDNINEINNEIISLSKIDQF